jgi:hypothetical protein
MSMEKRDKRRFIRYDALHLLDFLELDEEGNFGTYSMGRTIDVSLDGLKLETNYPIEPNSRILVTVGIEDDLIDLEGKAIHSSPKEGRHVAGITFVRITKEGRRILSRYIEAFNQRRKQLETQEK